MTTGDSCHLQHCVDASRPSSASATRRRSSVIAARALRHVTTFSPWRLRPSEAHNSTRGLGRSGAPMTPDPSRPANPEPVKSLGLDAVGFCPEQITPPLLPAWNSPLSSEVGRRRTADARRLRHYPRNRSVFHHLIDASNLERHVVLDKSHVVLAARRRDNS